MGTILALVSGVLGMAMQVDIPLSPATQEVPVGDIADVALTAVAAGGPEDISAIDVILSWDPTRLELTGATDEDFTVFVSGFLPDPDGINLDITDGDALYTVLSPLGIPNTVPPDLLVTTFHFKVLAGGNPQGGKVSMVPTMGVFGKSRVLGDVPGEDVTGTLSDPVFITVPGGFGPPVDWPVGGGPCDVIVKDLTGDGILDIATPDSGTDTVTMLTNDGAGGFAVSTTIPLTVGDEPAALASGELISGDGCDLAVAAKGSDSVVIIDNAPTGTFGIAAILSTLPNTEPIGIDVGDLDGAGVDDIAVAMQGDLLIVGAGAVAISLNGGALATLTPPIGGFLRPQHVIICDLDGDGDNDVIATMMGTAFTPTVTDNVLLWENTGGGAFAAPITISVAQNPRGLCCLDIDDDGDLDFAVTAESFPSVLPGTVEVFLNDGLTAGLWSPGDFSSGGSFSSGLSPQDIACDDLTDDSIPGFCPRFDIVAVNFGSEDVTRYNGYDPDLGAFTSSQFALAGLAPVAVTIGELNGDKTPDVVVANKASNDVTVMLDVTPALAKKFGEGCPGVTGVPSIEAVGLPTFGNPAFGVKVTNARVFAPSLLGLSLTQVTTTLGPGCDLYLLPPLVLINAVTDALGEATVFLEIPGPSTAFAGCDAFFQYFIFDTAGAFNGQFAFSDALRIKVGN